MRLGAGGGEGCFSSPGYESGHFLELVARAIAPAAVETPSGGCLHAVVAGELENLPKSAAGVSRVNQVKRERDKILEKERIHGSNH